jgi:hypothetical protein
MDIVNELRGTAYDKDNMPRMKSERSCSVRLALAAAEDIERLREALKPFADVVKGNWSEQPDTMPMSYGFGSDKRFDLTLGDFRKARAALKGDE